MPLNIHLIDLVIIIAYFIICLGIGIYNAKRIKTLQHFALGSGSTPMAILLCAIFASSIGAGSIVGVTEKIYLLGIIFVINQLLSPLQQLVAAKVIASNIEKFKGCITISQIMHKLYGNAGRWVTNIASILMGISVIAAQASAIGVVFNYFLGIDFTDGILISYVVLTTYSLLGGIKAIIPTEVFKTIIFLVILPVSYIKSSTGMGSIHEILDKLPSSHLHIEPTAETIITIISFILFSLLPGISSPLVQRYLMAPGSKELKKTFIYLACLSLPFYIMICIIAYTVKALAPDIPASEAFLYYIAHFLPAGIKGLMVAGIMAIIMSMAESWLNSTSVIIVNDIIKVRFPNISDSKQLLALRMAVLILSLSSIAIVLGGKNILELIWLTHNFWYPLIAIPVYAGFMGFKANTQSFIASAILATMSTIIGRLIAGEFAIISFGFGIVGSAIGLFGMHYMQAGLVGLQFNMSINLKGFNSAVLAFKNCILNLIKKESDLQNPKLSKFCIIVFAYYMVYSLNLTTYYGDKIFANVLSIGYVSCLALAFRDVLCPKSLQKKYLNLYWYFLLIFCLPFTSSYMMFISRGQDFWVVNSIICGSTLFFFVDAITFLIFGTIGVLGGLILFNFTQHGLEPLHMIPTMGIASYTYLFLAMTALFFFRAKEKEHEEQVESMQIFGSAIAHEVRSPLANMTMSSEHLRSMMNDIDKIKEEHGQHYKVVINKEDYDLMHYIGDKMHSIASKGIHSVDGLLVALKTNIKDDEQSTLSMKKTVEKIMKEYAMFHDFASSVTVNIVNDFKFHGSSLFTKHMLFNLLNNAHRYGGQGVKVEIIVKKNRLYFRDNGKGIPKEILPRIFDKFFTSSKAGTGVGLAFCKLVMESMNGAIECKSKLGEYTLFKLSFPQNIC